MTRHPVSPSVPRQGPAVHGVECRCALPFPRSDGTDAPRGTERAASPFSEIRRDRGLARLPLLTDRRLVRKRETSPSLAGTNRTAPLAAAEPGRARTTTRGARTKTHTRTYANFRHLGACSHSGNAARRHRESSGTTWRGAAPRSASAGGGRCTAMFRRCRSEERCGGMQEWAFIECCACMWRNALL